MEKFNCPHFNGQVELSAERQGHIAERHPELYLRLKLLLSEVLSQPEHVRASVRNENSQLFSRFYPDLYGGKFVVAVVVSEKTSNRNWIVTAYLTRRLTEG